MATDKTPDLHLDFNVSCDDYDITSRKPLDALHIGIDLEDKANGTKRKFDASVMLGTKVDGEWGLLANRLLDVVSDMTNTLGDEGFKTESWSYSRHGMKSINKNVDVDWLAENLWVGLRAPVQDLSAEQPKARLFIMGNAALILSEAEIAMLVDIPPCEWWLPDYDPGDWLAHKGFFSLLSFEEKEREWTRTKILRGLEVAKDELAHYQKMIRIYEEQTGRSIDDE